MLSDYALRKAIAERRFWLGERETAEQDTSTYHRFRHRPCGINGKRRPFCPVLGRSQEKLIKRKRPTSWHSIRNSHFISPLEMERIERITYLRHKYRGGNIESSEKGTGLEGHGQEEETAGKNKDESREEDRAVQSQS